MLLWTPGGREGQKLRLWFAASCQSAQSGGRGKGMGGLLRDDSQGSCDNAPIQNNTNKESQRDESNVFCFCFFLFLFFFGIKISVRRLRGRYEK